MKPKLRTAGVLISAMLCGVVVFHAASAVALWSASVSTGVSISTAPQPAQLPVFRVGKSKATFVGGTGPFPTIAQVESQHMWLDFGVVAQGNSNNSNEILLIDNPGPASYALSASLSPEIRGLFSSVELLPAAVSPGGTATLAMKLDTHGVAIGSYEGTLTVSDLFGAFTSEIPVMVKVVAPGNSHAVTATVHRRVSPTVTSHAASARRSRRSVSAAKTTKTPTVVPAEPPRALEPTQPPTPEPSEPATSSP